MWVPNGFYKWQIIVPDIGMVMMTLMSTLKNFKINESISL